MKNIIIALAFLPLSALASAPAQVTVCHNGSNLSVNENALSAHLGHGDTLGECPVIPPVVPPVIPPVTPPVDNELLIANSLVVNKAKNATGSHRHCYVDWSIKDVVCPTGGLTWSDILHRILGL